MVAYKSDAGISVATGRIEVWPRDLMLCRTPHERLGFLLKEYPLLFGNNREETIAFFKAGWDNFRPVVSASLSTP